jgi:hypothetical protein
VNKVTGAREGGPYRDRLRGGCGAGQLEVAVIVKVGLCWSNTGKSCRNKGSAEFGEDVFEGGFGLVAVPGFGRVTAARSSRW